MNREESSERIDDYIDGLLDADARKAFESCMADDDALRVELDAVVELKRKAQALRASVLPDRDLWPGIKEAIDRPAPLIRFGSFRGRPTRYSPLRYIVAAAALVLLMVGVRAIVEMDSPSEATPPAPVVAEDPEMNRIEQEYAAAKAELLSELDALEATLPPETLSIVEENLAIIENAVNDISAALLENPKNAELERMLHAAYRSEVNLLHQAVRMAGDG